MTGRRAALGRLGALVAGVVLVAGGGITASAEPSPRPGGSGGASTYRYELTLAFEEDGERLVLEIEAAVDEAARRARMRFDRAGIAAIQGLPASALSRDVVLVQVDDRQYWTGLVEELLPFETSTAIRPDRWYEVDILREDEADGRMLSDLLDADALWDSLDIRTVDLERPDGNLERSARLAPATFGQLRDSAAAFDLVPISDEVVHVRTLQAPDGRLLELGYATGLRGRRISVDITITHHGQPVDIDIPAGVERLELPEAAATPRVRRIEVDPEAEAAARATSISDARWRMYGDLVDRLTDPAFEPDGRVLLHLSVRGAWEVPGTETVELTIEDDGRVVRVTDTTVFSSTDDYTSLRLSRAGVMRVLAEVTTLFPAALDDLDGGATISPTDRAARLEVGGLMVASMDRLGQTDGYTPEQLAWRERSGRLIERLTDLAWLGEDVVEPEAPWVPDSMTVLAGSISPRSGLPPGAPFAPWPLEPIEELATGTARNAYDELDLVICLEGDDVKPVFELLTGVNHAYLRVDDGMEWELNVRPHRPNYGLVGDPCRPRSRIAAD